jgi:hypothetical protein
MPNLIKIIPQTISINHANRRMEGRTHTYTHTHTHGQRYMRLFCAHRVKKAE